jgi:hypothetical protein
VFYLCTDGLLRQMLFLAACLLMAWPCMLTIVMLWPGAASLPVANTQATAAVVLE